MIRVQNHVQKVLMLVELQGQISDGYWENSRPYDHWKEPASSAVEVSPDGVIGTDFWPERSYNFASPELLEYVGDRMLRFAKAATLFPDMSSDLVHYIEYDDLFTRNLRGDYWDEIRSKFTNQYDINNQEQWKSLLEKIDGVNYTMADMKKDLKVLKEVFKTRLPR
jgi:hypothetical protein